MDPTADQPAEAHCVTTRDDGVPWLLPTSDEEWERFERMHRAGAIAWEEARRLIAGLKAADGVTGDD
jgi:hypothetical protein